jgi:hypothetical protein
VRSTRSLLLAGDHWLTATHPAAAGFPAGRQFMLYGPENDLSQGMRNWVAYGLWQQMGHWTSRLQYCEVFLVRGAVGAAGRGDDSALPGDASSSPDQLAS